MANPGRFRHLVTIMGPGASTKDEGGGVLPAAPVAVHADVWAAIEALTGSEQLRAMQVHASATHRITLREWLPGVDATMWVEFEGRTFEIIAPPVDPGERRGSLVLLTRERV